MDPANLADQHHARRAAEIRQYSAVVRWMKVVLPIGALVLIGLIFVQGDDRGAVIDMQSAADAAILGAGLTLENPRFAGTTEDGQPFIVTAKSALPDGAVPNRIELDQPSGEVRLGDGMILTVTATSGEMFRKDELLHLNGDVTLVTSNGYRAETETVELDIAAKSAVVPHRVHAVGPRGGISADRMEVSQATGAKRLLNALFEGNVKVVFQPAAK